MTIQLFLISLILPILAFLFEIYPRLMNRNIGVDIWTHLLYLKEYRKQKGIPKKISEGFLVPGEYDYPPMFISIMSRFPLALVEKYEFFFSPFFDSLHMIFFFYISLILSGNIALAVVTQLLYMITPIITIENSSATPRSLGYTLFSLVFFCIFVFTNSGNPVFLLLAIIAGSFIFLSHRFTTQGFLFFSLFFSIIEKNIDYIFVFISAFFVAIVLSKGFYLKVLRGHIGNLYFWRKNIKYRFYHQVKGNPKSHKTSDFVFRVYNQFISIPPVVLAVTNPWIIFIFLSLFFITYPEGHLFRLLIWVLFSYVLALATIGLEKLRFLGEGQRYLELSAFPAAFLATHFLFSQLGKSSFFYLLFAYSVVALAAITTIVVIQRKAIIKDRLRTLTPELSQMYAFLKKQKRKPKLLCIPHQITTNTIYHTECPVFVNAGYANIDKISRVYPFLRSSIKDIMNTYSLDAILLNEDYAAIKDLKIKRFKEIKRYNNIVLLKVL